jgi:hypothetical protein
MLCVLVLQKDAKSQSKYKDIFRATLFSPDSGWEDIVRLTCVFVAKKELVLD